MAEEMMKEEMQQGQEVDPKLEKEVQAFVGSITKMLHGRETKGKIYEMLKSAPADKSVPEAVFQTNLMVAEKLKSKGQKPSLEAMFAGTLFAASELVDIGNAGGFFEQPIAEEAMQPVLQSSLQRMIEEGVRRKLVDPVELQEKIEPLLNDEQRQMGLAAGQKTGIPAEAGTGQAMEAYANERVEKSKQMIAQKQSAQNRQSMMQQAQQGGA